MLSTAYLHWPLVALVACVAVAAFAFPERRKRAAWLGAAVFVTVLGWSCAVMPPVSLVLPVGIATYACVLWASVLAMFACAPRRKARPVAFAAVASFVLAAVLSVLTFPGFNAERYASLVQPVEASRDAALPLTDQSQARTVTHQLATRRAAELLSSADEQGIGSRVEIGEMWGSSVGGVLYWIAPLEHSGFLRWLTFRSTPGYAMVSQYNEANARLVQDRPVRVAPNAWFGDSLDRVLYGAGLTGYAYADPVFQVDGAGYPKWVVAMLRPQVGLGGRMPVRWAVVDAGSGVVETFDSPDSLPEWVGRAFPQALIAERFDDWGCLGRGWIACRFTGQGVIASTPGINVTIDPDGRIIYYSGTQFQSTTAQGATSGVYIADARTGRITFFARAGLTETAAQAVMTQAWANYGGYRAQPPLLITVNGQEAYYAIVTDAAGTRRGFSLVAQDNRNIVGSGSSVQAAVADFTRAMRRSSRDSALEPGRGAESVSAEGTVADFRPVVQGGETVFYFTLDTMPGKILAVADERAGPVIVTREGDRVRVQADSFAPGVVHLTGFENLRFRMREEGIQPAVDARGDGEREDAPEGVGDSD